MPKMLIELEAVNYSDEEIHDIVKGRDILEDPDENSIGFSKNQLVRQVVPTGVPQVVKNISGTR